MAKEKKGSIRYTKSSAALISVAVHAVLLIVALSFVAVTVITKEEQKFEAKPVNRPKMQLKKLQVPVNMKKKKTKKPKLRKRIVVKPKLNQNVPDIKMPEITGVKGGMGNAGSGIGGAGGLGFSMPEIELFGIKSKGEKIFLILDAGNHMLVDEMGGIPAFTIIKEELLRIVEELPPTALFNICIFDGEERTVFPSLVSANSANTARAKEWLSPLNASEVAVRSGSYGINSLGTSGVKLDEDFRIGRFSEPIKKGGPVYGDQWGADVWYDSLMIAMKQQADTVFLLTNDWGRQRVAVSEMSSMDVWQVSTSAGQKWASCVKKGKGMLAEENVRRKKAGQPPKVLAGGEWGIMNEYFPDEQRPPEPEWYYFKPKEFAEAMVLTQRKFKSKDLPHSSGLTSKVKSNFSLNVVQFLAVNEKPNSSSQNFQQLTSICKGDYRTVAGLDEIKDLVAAVK